MIGEADDAIIQLAAGEQPPSGLSDLAPGVYDFAVLAAELHYSPRGHELECRIKLQVVGGERDDGLVLERHFRFGAQWEVDQLGATLYGLGYDVLAWEAPKRPFSRQARKIMQSLPGVRFRARVIHEDRGDCGMLVYWRVLSRLETVNNDRPNTTDDPNSRDSAGGPHQG